MKFKGIVHHAIGLAFLATITGTAVVRADEDPYWARLGGVKPNDQLVVNLDSLANTQGAGSGDFQVKLSLVQLRPTGKEDTAPFEHDTFPFGESDSATHQTLLQTITVKDLKKGTSQHIRQNITLTGAQLKDAAKLFGFWTEDSVISLQVEVYKNGKSMGFNRITLNPPPGEKYPEAAARFRKAWGEIQWGKTVQAHSSMGGMVPEYSVTAYHNDLVTTVPSSLTAPNGGRAPAVETKNMNKNVPVQTTGGTAGVSVAPQSGSAQLPPQ